MKVLVVESSRFHQIMISQIFNNEGLVVRIASNSEEAFTILAQETIDFVCTAYQLPSAIDGVKLAQLIRKSPRTKDIPVILLTSNDIDSSFDHAYSSGVTEIYNRSDVTKLSKNLKASKKNRRNEINARVLFIEDSKTMAAKMIKLMQALKMSFKHFQSADEALRAFRQSSIEYDLIITDLLVEGDLNGMGFIREVRKIIPDRSKLPILVLSGHDDVARRIELLNMGANDYIVKPIVKEELIARLSNLITTKQLFDQVKMQQEQLFQLAMTDQLTGLYNRHSLTHLLPKYLSHSLEQSYPMSVLILDIDHFKRINDTYGHSKGDEVLSQFGQLMQASFHSKDLIARYGGEEFIVVMANSTADEAIEKAEQLRTHMARHEIAGLKVTISIGVTAEDSDYDFDSMLNQADKALYYAKEHGRNRTIRYPLDVVTV